MGHSGSCTRPITTGAYPCSGPGMVGSRAMLSAGPGRRPFSPDGGCSAQAGYILTGETLRDRTLIEPLRPFDLRPSRFGLGAFEVTARYSELELSRQVFTAGLADPNLWTNHTQG